MLINAQFSAEAIECLAGKAQFPRSHTAISGHRYYSPSQGRFLGRDPIEEKGGLHLYAFCLNNAISGYDVLGNYDAQQAWDFAMGSGYMPGTVQFQKAFEQSCGEQDEDIVAMSNFDFGAADAVLSQMLGGYAITDINDTTLMGMGSVTYVSTASGQFVNTSITGGSTLTLGSLANSPGSGTVTVAQGTITKNADGTYTYTPSPTPTTLVGPAAPNSGLSFGDQVRIVLGAANAVSPNPVVSVIDNGIATTQLTGSVYAGVNAAVNPAYGVIAGSYQAGTGMSLNPDTAGQTLTTGGRVLSGVSAGVSAASLVFGAVSVAPSVASLGSFGTVTVVHFTDQAGVNAIQAASSLRAGTFVTLPSEVGGLSAGQVTTALEIQSGRGAFSTTFQVPASNLAIPENGALTSGGRIQFQLTQPATPAPFVPTPAPPPIH